MNSRAQKIKYDIENGKKKEKKEEKEEEEEEGEKKEEKMKLGFTNAFFGHL